VPLSIQEQDCRRGSPRRRLSDLLLQPFNESSQAKPASFGFVRPVRSRAVIIDRSAPFHVDLLSAGEAQGHQSLREQLTLSAESIHKANEYN